jgi:MerR family Zn(II)-responsive transcriptional regulator of zntA
MENGSGSNGQHIRIGDLARRAGTTMRTIRYYEQRGLIVPVARTKGGFRLYAEQDVRRLHLIKQLQLLDLPLAQVKALLDQRKPGRSAAEVAPELVKVLHAQEQELEGRIAQYRAMQDSLRETLEILRTCSECPREPGLAVCPQCPAVASRLQIPLHMRAIIEAG